MQTDNKNLLCSLTNGLLKFLSRFSGRRRIDCESHHRHINNKSNRQPHNLSRCFQLNHLAVPLVSILLLSAICDVTDACSSRTVPRPRPTRPAVTTTPRPNITFHTYKCPEAYATWYCLNGATCFAVKLGSEVLYNCECPSGYIGPRCDYKELDGSYLAGRSRVMLETASVAGGAVVALLLFVVVVIFVYIKKHNTKECEFEVESQETTPHDQFQQCQHCQLSEINESA